MCGRARTSFVLIARMAAFVPLVVFANIGRAVGRRNDIAKSKDQFGEVRLRA